MPDSGQDLISPAELFGGLEDLCAHYVFSDLRLLSDSLDGLRNPGAIEVPCILNAPAMDARLTFDYSVNEEKKILLGLRRRNRSERVARFDVHMKLCPTAGAGFTDPGPARLYGTWPLFIEPAGTGRSFSLVLDKTVRLRVRMPEVDEFDAATIETEKGVVTFDRLSPGLIVSLTMAIARWTRDKTSSEPSPFAGGPQTFLENFLGMLTVRVNAFMRDTAVLFQPEEDRKETADDALRIRIAGYRRTISRMIGQGYTHYRFADLSSRLRFLLDSEGDLATDPFSRWNRQYDIEAKLARTSRGNGIVVSLNIPDLLVSGPYYGGILEAVIQSEALSGLVEDRSDDLPAHLALTRAALVACLRKAKISGGAVIARIERAGSGEDLDFLLVRTGASLGATWLLFMFRVSFSHRNTDVPEIDGIGELRLVAAVNSDGEWLGNADDREELGAYLYRVLLVLYNWRLRFGKAEG